MHPRALTGQSTEELKDCSLTANNQDLPLLEETPASARPGGSLIRGQRGTSMVIARAILTIISTIYEFIPREMSAFGARHACCKSG